MLDLRNPYERDRWDRICNRWLTLTLVILWFVAVWHLTPGGPDFANYFLTYAFIAPLVAFIGWFVILWLCALVDWLKGY